MPAVMDVQRDSEITILSFLYNLKSVFIHENIAVLQLFDIHIIQRQIFTNPTIDNMSCFETVEVKDTLLSVIPCSAFCV